MDDFSMDLLPTMRSAAAMRRAGRVVPARLRGRLVLLSLAHVSLMTGQYPHQTGFAPMSAAADPWAARRLPARSRPTATPNGRQRQSLQAAGYVRASRQVLNQLRVPPRPVSTSRAAGLVGVRRGLGVGLRRVGLRPEARARRADRRGPPPAPTARGHRRREGRRVRRSVIERSALDFIRRHRGTRAVLPGGCALRSAQPRRRWVGRVPRRPPVPPAVPRPALRRAPGGNCGLVPARNSPRRTCPGTATRPADNCAGRNGSRPTVARRAPRRSPAWPPGSCGTGPGWCRRWTGWSAHPGRGGRQHLRRADLRQRVPPGADGARLGKGTPYDTDAHVPLLVMGPGSSQVSGTMTSPTSTWRRPSRTWPEHDPAYRSGELPRRPSRGTAGEVTRHVFFEHTARRPRSDADPAAARRELSRRDPLVCRGAQPARRCWSGSTSTRAGPAWTWPGGTTTTATPAGRGQTRTTKSRARRPDRAAGPEA